MEFSFNINLKSIHSMPNTFVTNLNLYYKMTNFKPKMKNFKITLLLLDFLFLVFCFEKIPLFNIWQFPEK